VKKEEKRRGTGEEEDVGEMVNRRKRDCANGSATCEEAGKEEKGEENNS